MAEKHYLMKYVGKYRVLPRYDINTKDFPRNTNGDITEGFDDIYIACHNNCEIFDYGHEEGNKRLEWLVAYIPSIGRGHNVLNAVKEKGVLLHNIEETDSEIMFRFRAKDIDVVAELLKAKTIGANISPFSSKNFPKSNVKLPKEEELEYKSVISNVSKENLLLIHKITSSFLEECLQKKFKKKDKNFNYKSDMKKMCMFRQSKEYIYTKGLWKEYINYFKKQLNIDTIK